MKYLVCRKDAMRPGHSINSSCFPIVVEFSHPPTAEEIVRKAFDTFGTAYVGKHEYVIIPMIDAQIVSLVPRPTYDVQVTPYG